MVSSIGYGLNDVLGGGAYRVGVGEGYLSCVGGSRGEDACEGDGG